MNLESETTFNATMNAAKSYEAQKASNPKTLLSNHVKYVNQLVESDKIDNWSKVRYLDISEAVIEKISEQFLDLFPYVHVVAEPTGNIFFKDREIQYIVKTITVPFYTPTPLNNLRDEYVVNELVTGLSSLFQEILDSGNILILYTLLSNPFQTSTTSVQGRYASVKP